MSKWLSHLFSLFILFSGCSSHNETTSNALPSTPKVSTNIRFDELTQQAGVHFIPHNGQEAGQYAILESLGTGIGIGDFDCDGRLDFIAAGGGKYSSEGNPLGLPSVLYRQTSDWQFSDVSADAGLFSQSFYSHGVVIADWNSDGFPDYLLTGYEGLQANENCGDGTFLDVTEAMFEGFRGWYTSGACGDFDNDGFIDLYLVRYVKWSPEINKPCYVRGQRDVCPPGEYAAESDQIWWNQKNGTFSESSRERGITISGKGLAAISGDIDLDGDTDIYVANDTTPNLYYVNDGNGFFTEEGLIAGTSLGMSAEAEGSMGVELADFNNDLLPDLWVSNFENQSFALYQGQAPGVFQHVSDIKGITAVGQVYVGFGTVALDADLDGDQDIFATNGHVMYHARNSEIQQKPLIFENKNSKRFTNIADIAGEYSSDLHMGRGLAAGDLDHDGREDLVISHTNEPISVLKNNSKTSRNSLMVQLIGSTVNRDAIGTSIVLRSEKETQIKFIRGGGSYLSTHSSDIIFGLSGNSDEVVLEIYWPGGKIERIHPQGRKIIQHIQ